MAIALAAPSNQLFLSRTADDYEARNKQMRHFSEIVRRRHPTYAHVWSAEVNQGGTELHLHGFFHAEGADESGLLVDLIDARDRAGFGLESGFELLPKDFGAPYFSYPFNQLADPSANAAYLGMNGPPKPQKYVHSSRRGPKSVGFWRNGPGGESLTQSEAEAIASRRYWTSHRWSVPIGAS